MSRTLVDLNDIIHEMTMMAATIFRYTKTPMTVIGSADITRLVREIMLDIVNNQIGANVPSFAESISDDIYRRLTILKQTFDPGLTGVERWYDFVDFSISMPLESLIRDHCAKFGAVQGIEVCPTVCKNLCVIY